MRVDGLFPLLIILLATGAVLAVAEAPSVSAVTGSIIYDLEANEGVAVLNFTLTAPVANTTLVIPLPANNLVEVFNVTDESGNILAFRYSSENKTLEVMVFENPVKQISVVYNITNLFTEIGVGAYSAVVDLTQYSGSSVSLSITLLGTYSVQAVPGVKVVAENGVTTILLDKPELYLITVYVELETGTPITTPATQQTPTPQPSTPPSTPPPQPSAPPSTPETTTPAAAPVPDYTAVLVAVVIAVALIALIAFLLRKRK